MKPEETYTIKQFITNDNDNNISYDSLCFLDYISATQKIISYNVLNDYIKEIDDLTVFIEFDDKEYIRYLYKPKLLAYDVYGDAELYFIILYINSIYTVKDFNFKKVRMLKKDTLEFILSSIYNAEKDNIDAYNSKEV